MPASVIVIVRCPKYLAAPTRIPNYSADVVVPADRKEASELRVAALGNGINCVAAICRRQSVVVVVVVVVVVAAIIQLVTVTLNS
jgi:hypothetical protein